MIAVKAYPIRCPVCSWNARYKTTSMDIAAQFQCPHDGSKVEVLPAEVITGTYTQPDSFKQQLTQYATDKLRGSNAV